MFAQVDFVNIWFFSRFCKALNQTITEQCGEDKNCVGVAKIKMCMLVMH